MNKLLPCPFCGKTRLWISDEADFNYLQSKHGKACIALVCETPNCHVEMFEHTYSVKDYNKRLEMLVSKWNRRF